jgi:RimJ/RimL family protein N-acetyltransferase
MVLDVSSHYRYIRKLQDSDLASIALWDRDDEVTLFSGKKFGGDAVMNAAWWRDLLTNPLRIGFAVQTVNGVLIGDAELEHITWRNGEAELRISIGDKRHWNQGYGSRAVWELLDVAYERIGLQRRDHMGDVGLAPIKPLRGRVRGPERRSHGSLRLRVVLERPTGPGT